MVSGLEVKRSLGIARGKSDEVDAEKIAEYAYLRKDKIKLYTLPSKSILCLKPLLSLRERMVSQKAGYQATLKENKRIFNEKENRVLFKTLDRLLVSLEEEIEKVEKEMLAIIKEDKELSRLYELVTSIKGVGLVLGITLLVYTNCFSSFDNWRKFACYSGVAPFEYKSGTSIKGKNKVSHLANKKIKALLTNAALSSIRHDPEMKSYYNNRVKKGKNSMSTINVVRNKILSRVFAVAKRGTAYVITHQYAA
jgi:transposase